jgi:hypothetical protein
MADETTHEQRHDECGHGHKHHKHGHHGQVMFGPIWCIGWLFTIGFTHMPFFWKGVWALLLWPLYLGQALFRPLM